MSPSRAHDHAGSAAAARALVPALYRTTARFLTAGDTLELVRHIVGAARELTQATGVAILLYDAAQDLFVPMVPSVALGLDERWLQRQGLPAAQSLAGRARQERALVDVPDTAATPELDYPLLAGRRRPGAVVAVPLIAEEQVLGVLGLYHAQPRGAALDQGDQEALVSFAELAAVALARMGARERERSALARVEAIEEASAVLTAELALDRVLQRIVEVAARLVGARYGALGVVGEDGYLSDFITVGLSAEERAALGPLPRGHGLLGVLIREGQPLRVTNIQRDPRRVGFPPHHPPMTSLLGVPIRVREEIVGDLYLADKIGAPAFTAEDQRLIEMLAVHAGIAIENARLYDQLHDLTLLRERERFGRDLHDGIIQDLYGISLQLENLAEDVGEERLQRELGALAEGVTDVITAVRRYIEGLRVSELDGQLLHESLVALAQEINAPGALTVSATVEGTPYPLSEALAHTLFQIAREALTNVVKHAGASQAALDVRYAETAVVLTVRDNGRGFDPAQPQGEAHRGLRNLQARAAEVGGTAQVASAPGSGTTITVMVPPS